MRAIIGGIEHLRMEMYDCWNQDIPCGAHNDPPTDDFELLDEIIEAETELE